MKKLLLLGTIGYVVIIFVLIMLTGMISGGSGGSVIGPVATEEKAEDYGVMASEFGVPWDIVMLADAITESRRGGNLESMYPIYSVLKFMKMDVSVETYEVVDFQFSTNESVYGWVSDGTDTYEGLDDILNELQINYGDIYNDTSAEFILRAQEAADKMSGDDTRYTITFNPNTDYEYVLKKYYSLSEKEIEDIMLLHDEDYMEQINMSEELQEKIHNIQEKN